MDADSPIAKLLETTGGHDELARLFQTEDDESLRQLFNAHGMGYVVHDVSASLEDEADAKFTTADGILDCPIYFNTALRDAWHAVRGAGSYEAHFINEEGLPHIAYKDLGIISTAPRYTTCQRDVGNLAASSDGGHLIGSQLGGWGKRANLAPQNSNFNRGNWLQLENKLKDCEYLNSTYAYVYAIYPDGSTNPVYWDLRATVQGNTQWALFDNAYQGGIYGTNTRQEMINWLTQRGCS